MERHVFESRLREATDRVLGFTRSLVIEELPDDVLYLIRPNSSYDGNPLEGDEEVFPEDSLPEGHFHLPPVDAAGVVDFLWRQRGSGDDGKVPEWVNVTVVRADATHTYVFLRCCGRFTAGRHLYHTFEGIPPFHVMSPPLPREWGVGSLSRSLKEQVAEHGRFPLPAFED